MISCIFNNAQCSHLCFPRISCVCGWVPAHMISSPIEFPAQIVDVPLIPTHFVDFTNDSYTFGWFLYVPHTCCGFPTLVLHMWLVSKLFLNMLCVFHIKKMQSATMQYPEMQSPELCKLEHPAISGILQSQEYCNPKEFDFKCTMCGEEM